MLSIRASSDDPLLVGIMTHAWTGERMMTQVARSRRFRQVYAVLMRSLLLPRLRLNDPRCTRISLEPRRSHGTCASLLRSNTCTSRRVHARDTRASMVVAAGPGMRAKELNYTYQYTAVD